MLSILGTSLNVISLAGLAFAIGMFIDNAIVVLENIYRRHSLGEPPFTAAVRGTQEVWGAILASSLTNIAVFLPVIFMQEEAGQLFRDIALAITGALALSVVVAVTVIPAATARLFRGHGKLNFGETKAEPRSQRMDGSNGEAASHMPAHPVHDAAQNRGQSTWKRRLNQFAVGPMNAFGAGFSATVTGVNRWALRSVPRRLLVVGVMIGASMGLTWIFWPKVEYLPTGNRNLVFGILLPPPGYNLDELLAMGRIVENELHPYFDVDVGTPEAEALDAPVIDDFFFVARGRQVFIGLRAVDPARAAELVPLVMRIGREKLVGTIAVASQLSLFGRGLEGGRVIDVEITGPELGRLVAMGGQIMGQVMQLLPNSMPRPIPSLDLSSPELHVTPKLLQAADMRVSAADLGFTVNALVDGAYVSDYFLNGKKIDLTVTGKRPSSMGQGESEDAFRWNTQDVEALPIATPMGQLVPLSALADVQLDSGPEQVNHRERVRAITIQVSPPPEVPLEAAMLTIENQIVRPLVESGQLEGGYQINMAGTADKLRDTWKALRFNFLLASIITYLLMAALFESWLYPLVIIFSVPLGAVGGILGLWLLNGYLWMTHDLFVPQTLDVLTMLGFVILVGTVVNNPILIVHQALNHIREDGMAFHDAVLESTRTRLRPIFATTVTTVLGLLPLVLFPGAGSELYRGLGAVLLGGLVISTVFTLFLIPALFSLAMDTKQWLARRLLGRESVVHWESPLHEESRAEKAASPRPEPAATR
jgi:HAE1 family hydrophobic/amphiphilic exporter-1